MSLLLTIRIFPNTEPNWFTRIREKKRRRVTTVISCNHREYTTAMLVHLFCNHDPTTNHIISYKRKVTDAAINELFSLDSDFPLYLRTLSMNSTPYSVKILVAVCRTTCLSMFQTCGLVQFRFVFACFCVYARLWSIHGCSLEYVCQA